MPRPAAITKKVRLNLEVSVSVRKRLEKLQIQTGAESLTEVIRRALAMYEYAVSVKSGGGRLLVERGGNTLEVALFE